MKKILAVFLAALMLCSALGAFALAAEKYPDPTAPANLTLTEDGVASWDASVIGEYTVPEGSEVVCVVKYRVKLFVWDYDTNRENWTYVQVGNEVVTTDTSVDFSDRMVSGKFIFSVSAIAEYTRTTASATDAFYFKKFSETVEMDRDAAVKVTPDLFKDPVDNSLAFESLVKEDNEQANTIIGFLKKIKEVFLIILRFLGYAGDLTGISEGIWND